MTRALGPAFEPAGLVDAAADGVARRIGAVLHVASGVTLHLVPGGAFTMGQPGGLAREQPVREVTLGPLLVGRAPVLRGEWARITGEAPAGDPALPMTGVTWFRAREWLERAGGGLRLPSEAEWERAARAGSLTPFPWGERVDRARCHAHRPGVTGPRRPSAENAFGLLDCHGNVAEWCHDELVGPMEGSAWQEWDPGRAVRGGSFDLPASQARSAFRAGRDPRRADPDLGLRAFAAPPPGSWAPDP